MAIRTELSLQLPNSPGALSAVCQLLTNQRVNILAMALEGNGQLRLIVDNHVGALGLLRARQHHMTEREVLVTTVSHGPGAIQPLLQRIAEAGVNVNYVYGGAAEISDLAMVVIAVDDVRRASAAAGV